MSWRRKTSRKRREPKARRLLNPDWDELSVLPIGSITGSMISISARRQGQDSKVELQRRISSVATRRKKAGTAAALFNPRYSTVNVEPESGSQEATDNPIPGFAFSNG